MNLAERTLRLASPVLLVAAVVAMLLIVFPVGFPNYDTMYFLVWGRELGEGLSPDYGPALPPTPHPLATLVAAVFSPLGEGAIAATMVLAYASLGIVGYLVYKLGCRWFDRPIGALAAVIVLTRGAQPPRRSAPRPGTRPAALNRSSVPASRPRPGAATSWRPRARS